ncbi:MAG: hypothetical protein KBC05_20585 [Candidatus Hydrogenedentes bacterium]|nr:hypothetical protein [Candidatus Hydrogenedentota bacterium]
MTDAEKLAERIAAYRAKGGCLKFVEEVIRPEIISADQRKVLAEVGPDCRISVVSGTTVGKTALVAWVLIWFICCHAEGKCVVTSTKYDQCIKIVWPEVKKWSERLPAVIRATFTITSERIFLVPSLKDKCFASPETAAKENVAAYQGRHGTSFLILFDEAAGIAHEIWEAARGCFSTPGAMWICTGNGNYASGDFYETHHKNREFWTPFSFSSEDSPFVSKSYCAEMEKEFGKDSNMYRIRVLGKFPKSDPDTLIPFDWVEEAKDREVKPDAMVERIAGLDPSGGGADPVGFCIRQGTLAYCFQEWNAIEAMPTVGRVLKMWERKMFDKIAVDAIGVGSGVVSRLEELGVPVIPVNVGMPPILRPSCFRLRDDLWWAAREWFESRIVRVEAGEGGSEKAVDKFIHEVTAPKSVPHSTGKDKVEGKDSLRKAGRLGYSPGLADAFCLTFARGIPVRTSSRRALADLPAQDGSGYVW